MRVTDNLNFEFARLWPGPFPVGVFKGRCPHCQKLTYVNNGVLFHIDGYRPCHWSASTHAEL